MIKINLATRKQVAGARASEPTGASLQGILSGIKVDGRLDGLKELPLRKIVLAAAVCFGADYLLDNYKEDELARVDTIIVKARDEQTHLRNELSKAKGFEEMKKSLDADQESLQVKIDTITKLLDARQDPPKMMVSLSSSIPTNVWLSSLKISDKGVVFQGQALGFSLISDFMRNLGESAYFTALTLQGTQKDQAASVDGKEIVAFELGAKRR